MAVALAAIAGQACADKLPRLVLAGPTAAVSFPLIHMAESGALADIAESVEFVAWRDPDQLRVLALDGKADVLAMPTNVAANLYNRGAPVRLVNVSTWGILWLLSRDAEIATLDDLRGEEIAMPFRADMPDLLFGAISEGLGLDPRSDFKLRYVATPMDAMQLLIARRVDHALLAEPAVSMALRRTQSFPVSVIAPELHRAVDLQAEWGRAFGRGARIPQAGIAVMGALRAQPQLIAAIEAAYRDSLAWCQADAGACGELVARHIDMLSAEAVADAVAASPLEAVPAAEARAELEFLYTTLMARSPAVVGGRMPDDAFYGAAAQ
ncbi:MAG TPA: ABC transporter substrate-binding protein [Rhodocyclaceae bacterium]|nr:ABC transporter substrate-binding protein [Rhodocyclaceae bacterium]